VEYPWDGNQRLYLYEVATRQRRCDLPGWGASWCGKLLACLSADRHVQIWDMVSGKMVRQFPGAASLRCLAFSEDGNALAVGGVDTTITLWDLRNIRRGGPTAPALTPEAVAELWKDLGGKDAAKAYSAVIRLAAAPKAVLPVLQERLKPVGKTAPRICELVADLESQRFEVRNKACEELEKLGEQAEAALRQLAKKKPSLEVQRRLDALLNKLEGPELPAAKLQVLRAVEALELAGTAEARQLLDTLAKGEDEAWLTRHAKTALERLARS
jgi:hypothetical protein